MPRSRGRWRPVWALHLLWTVPLAVALSILPWIYGVVSICGVSGCGGGGFGPAYGPDYEWILPFCVIGVLLFLAIVLVPWQRPAIRFAVAAGVGLLVVGILVSQGYAAKYPLIR